MAGVFLGWLILPLLPRRHPWVPLGNVGVHRAVWRSVGPPWCERCSPAFFSSLYTVCLSLAFWRQPASELGAGTVWSSISLSSEGCRPSLNLIMTPMSNLL